MVDRKDLKLVIPHRVSSLLAKVSHQLTELDVESYLVGGFVRDTLLGRDTADLDIAIAADALEIAPKVAAALGGKYIRLDEVNRVGRVVLVNKKDPSVREPWQLDFSTFRDSIELDLKRRDFTIDAMAINLKDIHPQTPSPSKERGGKRDEAPDRLPRLIDPCHGLDDLRQGVIRAVSPTAFERDAVRLLRAVRLAAELGFSIDRETETLIRRHSPLITSVAGERLREELLRLLALPQTKTLWYYLEELGILTALIPELALTKGVAQPKEHFWDVFNHSLETVATTDFLLRQGDWDYAGEECLAAVPWSAELAQHFEAEVSHGSTRRSLLKLAALLHDLAKPQTKATDAKGRMRFLGHTGEGAAMAANILERLRFSTKEIKLVETVVKHHLRPGQMSHLDLPSRRAIYRYFRDTAETGVDILFLSLADHLATRGPRLNLAEWHQHTQLVEYVLTQRFQEESLTTPPKLVDGHDLISTFGLNPGPEIGELLETVREAQAAGELTTREESLAYIDKLLASPPDPLAFKGEEEKSKKKDLAPLRLPMGPGE